MRLEGQQIGRYNFKQLIGAGGAGDVYLAEDPRIQQQVAIKVIQFGDLTFSPADRANNMARFQQEAAAIANLNHPHIVHLNDYNEADVGGTKITYIVTPFYKAGSFANWLRGRGSQSLSLQDIADIVRQAADALQYTHQHHIIHQDVKPSNFLIDNEENPKQPNLLLTDFGISEFSDAATYAATSPSLGTLTYMAPEQLNGRPVYASDQYSLAVMTYELLTGRPPFQGPPQIVMDQHFNAQPQPPSTLNPGIPKSIDSVILRALAKRPEDRFDSVAAFANAFQQGLQRSDAFPQTPPPRGKVINQIPPPPPAPNFTGRGAYSNAVPRPDIVAHMVNVPPPQKRGSRARTILLAVLALVIILGGVGAFFVINNNQVAQQNINATATANSNVTATTQAHTHTLATATAYAKITAIAAANATATTVVTSQYPPFTKLALYDPLTSSNSQWQSASECQFMPVGYQVSIAEAGFFQRCLNTKQLGELAYQATMNIKQGDCGGLIFRYVDSNNFYLFIVCQNGRYNVSEFISGKVYYLYSNGRSHPAIHQGVNQSNVIAVSIQGGTINMYVNGQKIDTATSTGLTSSTFNQGQIGLFAYDITNPTSVIYTNVLTWTAS